MDVPIPLARYRRDVDAFLRLFLNREGCGQLYRMARYHMGWEDQDGRPSDQPGKGLRPALLLLACQAAGGDWHRALPAAAAVELVHNFSLIHDDIQDRDAERHHRPTVWKVWGDSQGINAGDALMALSRLALLRLHDEGVPPDVVIDAARILDERTLEMVEGQVMDLAFEGTDDVCLADYLVMIEKKTGALFDCSLSLGALVAGGDRELAQSMGNVGRLLGVAFQIRDDMLGIWGAENRTGKEPAADIRRRKKSLPIVLALTGEDRDAAVCVQRIHQQSELGDADISMVLRALDSIGVQGHCSVLGDEQKQEALAGLEALPLVEERAAELRETAEFLLARDF